MPLELWSNIRFFKFEDARPPPGALMDKVGMSQFDEPGHEACFPLDDCAPDEPPTS
jgi:hypothetical protein